MEYAKILLTEDQRLEQTKIPDDVRDWKTAKYYTLNPTCHIFPLKMPKLGYSKNVYYTYTAY